MTHERFKEAVCEAGHEDAMVFDSPSFDSALVGFSHDGRAVYDFDKMVDCLVEEDGMEYEEAVEFIEYNTIRSIPYAGASAPIVMYKFDIENEI